MTPSLPPRLRGLLQLVPIDAGCVADVGAGHGALSARLAARGHRVIATEARQGPFNELRRNLSRWHMDRTVEARLGPGLAPLRAGEVDLAVVAGMGAHTALGITDAAAGHRIRFLLLQCMQHHRLVEPWIEERGFRLVRRVDPADRGRVYPTWLVEVTPAA